MITRAQMLREAEDLMCRVQGLRADVEILKPERLETCRMICRDIERAHNLIKWSKLAPNDRIEIADCIERATLNSIALWSPVQ